MSKTEHFVGGGGGGGMGKRGRAETRSRPRDPGTTREESSLPSRTAACELPNGKGAGKRHQIGKCYPAAYGFRTRPGAWCLLQGKGCDQLILWLALFFFFFAPGPGKGRPATAVGGNGVRSPWEVLGRRHRPEPPLGASRLQDAGWLIILCTGCPQDASTSKI